MAMDMIYFDAAKAASLYGKPISGADLESKIFADASALDLNKSDDGSATDGKPFHEKLKSATYVRAQGWASIEDYDRFKQMADNSNSIIEFIGRCTLQALEQSPDYQKAQQELDNLRGTLKKEVDRNKRSAMEARVKTMETRFRNMVAERTQLQGLPDWMVTGFQL